MGRLPPLRPWLFWKTAPWWYWVLLLGFAIFNVWLLAWMTNGLPTLIVRLGLASPSIFDANGFWDQWSRTIRESIGVLVGLLEVGLLTWLLRRAGRFSWARLGLTVISLLAAMVLVFFVWVIVSYATAPPDNS